MQAGDQRTQAARSLAKRAGGPIAVETKLSEAGPPGDGNVASARSAIPVARSQATSVFGEPESLGDAFVGFDECPDELVGNARAPLAGGTIHLTSAGDIRYPWRR